MMSVSCCKKSALSMNVWMFIFLPHSFLVVPLHCHSLHANNIIYNFTYLLMSLCLIKFVLSG